MRIEKKRLDSEKIGLFINNLILFVIALTCLYPFYRVYMYAFNNGLDSLRAPLYFWPRVWTLDNFKVALSGGGILNGFKISILRTVIGTFFQVLTPALWAYAMLNMKKDWPGYSFINNYFFISFMFSGGFIASYLLYRELHLLDTFTLFYITGLASYWNMIIMKTSYKNIPDSLLEAAEIDGASHMYIFFKIIAPLSKPVYATIALFCGVGHWNDWYMATFLIRKQSLQPLQNVLMKMMNQVDVINELVKSGQAQMITPEMLEKITPNSVRMAVLVVTVTPILLIYPFIQKYFDKGMMIGALKG